MRSHSESNKQVLRTPIKSTGSKPGPGVRDIPLAMGTGYIKGYVINPKLRLIVRQYELKEDFVLDRGIREEEKFVMITFHNIYRSQNDIKNRLLQPSTSSKLLPSVQIVTTGLNNELLPADKKINSIVITVHADYLKELLRLEVRSAFLKMITSGNQPFLFEEIISPEIQEVAAEIITGNPAKELENFYYKLKTEELIYLLFAELLKREDATLQALNSADVEKVYAVKDRILSKIDTPPTLSELVKFSGMSESKLKRLFKQIFGNSIYNYYQCFRMKEAAYLIKEEKLSVSEVGYRLGFSNLSHFSRLFETHIGLKPKKYSSL